MAEKKEIADELIDALLSNYEKTDDLLGKKGKTGEVSVAVPRDRDGSFEPQLVEKQLRYACAWPGGLPHRKR